MTIERALRAMAGFFVMLSVALGYWVHPGFFLFTAFVGLNLFQSAFTNTCPAMAIFRKMGLRACVPAGTRPRRGETDGPRRGRAGLTAARPRYWISIEPQRVPLGASGQPAAAQARYSPLSFAIARNWLPPWFPQTPGSDAHRASP